MLQHILLVFCLLFNTFLFSQHFTGHWEGRLTQTGKESVFTYQIDMVQNGKTITGTAISKLKGSDVQGAFQIVGTWDGQHFVFQEVMQTEPKNGGWCLKHARLTWTEDKGYPELVGDWEATGCVPGKIYLKNTSQSLIETQETVEVELPLAQAILGRWTGHLQQSDRGYGFFYEINLAAGSSGTSYIVSEGNGGSAYHSLHWSLDPTNRTIALEEIEVTSKTAEKWKWCIKKGTLQLKKDKHKYYLEGDWSGYLEDANPNSSRGKCAPGRIYLEKPILKKKELVNIETYQSNVATVTQQAGRNIKIARTIKVSKPQIRLKVWDNGSVDGDRITVFLNEKQLLHNFRVSKTKRSIPVNLNKSTNFLILHAENLGNISPNTVAVSIDDGTKEQVLILSSDLEESGAVMIKQFKVQ